MRRIWLCLFIVCSFICCNSNYSAGNNQKDSITTTNNDSTKTDSTTLKQKPIDADENSATSKCYAYLHNGDTIRLNITTKGNTFTGTLLYHLKEKDRSNGTVKGSIKGDTLLADYTFNAEGMQSVRQVAFLKQENNLKEGFGEVNEKEGNMVFKNPEQLSFTGFVLTSTACD